MTAFLDKFLNNPDAVEKTIVLNRYRLNKVQSKPKEEVLAMHDLTLEVKGGEGYFDVAHKQGLTLAFRTNVADRLRSEKRNRFRV